MMCSASAVEPATAIWTAAPARIQIAYSYGANGGQLTVDLAAGTTSDGNQLISIENASGSESADVLLGDAGSNVLLGRGGDDTLRGGGGADTLDGGDGFDIANYLTSDAAVTVDLGAHSVAGGDAQGDQLSGIEALRGSAYADMLTGDASANTLWGDSGNDVLTGSAGADKLDGGDGIDRTDYAASAAAIAINLATGASSGGDAAGDVLTAIENIGGSSFCRQLDRRCRRQRPVGPQRRRCAGWGRRRRFPLWRGRGRHAAEWRRRRPADRRRPGPMC